MSFILKDANSKDETHIILLYPCVDGRLKFYTGEKITPSLWKKNVVPKSIRAVLSRLSGKLEDTISDCKISGTSLTKSLLKGQLASVNILKPSGNFFDQMSAAIIDMESGKILTPRNKRYEPKTLKGLRHTVRILTKFDPTLTQSSVTISTYTRFIEWGTREKYSINYIGTQIKNWKTLGKAVGGSNVYDSPAFKILTEETQDIYLDETELTALWNVALNNRMSVVRDWFILDCYTGLRISDLMNLSKRNLSKGFITIANEKTDDKVVIPVHQRVKEILKRWKGFPPKVSDQEMNRIIKKVAEKARINKRVLFTITKGGKRVDHYLKKWELVSNHTARRSFITNLRKSGVPDSIVMKLAGIRSNVTLQRYDKIGPDEAAGIAAGLDYFK